MAEILLIRHGQTEWSRDMRHTGRTDVPLTAEGIRQAEALRPALAGRRLERVLTSPLERAADTCRLAGAGAGAEMHDDLLEWDYGDYEGLTTAAIRERRPSWSLWRDGCPGGETVAAVGARADRVIDELRELEGDAAVFAHGHVLRVLGARWIELGPEGGARLYLTTATVSVLGHERETPVIRSWNSSAARTGLS
jgi:broad specificity phosphatase PhoE